MRVSEWEWGELCVCVRVTDGRMRTSKSSPSWPVEEWSKFRMGSSDDSLGILVRVPSVLCCAYACACVCVWVGVFVFARVCACERRRVYTRARVGVYACVGTLMCLCMRVRECEHECGERYVSVFHWREGERSHFFFSLRGECTCQDKNVWNNTESSSQQGDIFR